MKTYYNEIDPFAAAWLENLIAAGLISGGRVDKRSIKDVRADDLAGYQRCHFFAGIAGWELALQLAGWPEGRPVWTGSCPCQPFSAAGKRRGVADERHLWPVFRELIRIGKPPTVFGEQVASKDGRLWLHGVRTDLEAMGYAVGAADLCAAGIEAPHIRQRLYWAAQRMDDPPSPRRDGQREWAEGEARDEARVRGFKLGCANGRLEHPQGDGRDERGSEPGGRSIASGCGVGRLADSEIDGLPRKQAPRAGRPGVAHRSPWSDAIWIPCSDGKQRRIKPGLAPLVDGFPGRVGRLRAYGNAIVPQVAAEFIKAYLECVPAPVNGRGEGR